MDWQDSKEITEYICGVSENDCKSYLTGRGNRNNIIFSHIGSVDIPDRGFLAKEIIEAEFGISQVGFTDTPINGYQYI